MIVGSLISGPSALSESSLYIWNFSVHVLLKPSLKDFEHYIASMWNKHNCTVVWVSFGMAFFWVWNENWPFPVLWPLLSFPNCRHYSYIHLSFSLISHLIAWGEFWELRDLVWFKSKMYISAAKSLQSFVTLCDPIDGSPPGSPVPGILQARTLEWVAISFSVFTW